MNEWMHDPIAHAEREDRLYDAIEAAERVLPGEPFYARSVKEPTVDMRLHELMEHLQTIAAEHGDARVYLTVDGESGSLRRVLGVDLTEPHQRGVVVELTTDLEDQ